MLSLSAKGSTRGGPAAHRAPEGHRIEPRQHVFGLRRAVGRRAFRQRTSRQAGSCESCDDGCVFVGRGFPWGRGSHAALAAVIVGTLGLTVVAGGSAAPQHTVAAHAVSGLRNGCRQVPQLTGLTLAKARRVAARSGCRIRVAGAPILSPSGQRVRISGGGDQRRIARQTPQPGARGQSIDVWLVAECAEMGAPGPPAGGPFVTVGPTELVSGLYIAGGPFEVFPGRCRHGFPGAGVIAVLDPASGATVASAMVANGHLATIPLAPGTYTIDGTFADATVDGVSMKSSLSVTIPAGRTVRQDIVASVP